MMKEFGRSSMLFLTLRESLSATRNGWKALIYDGKEFYQSKHYDINPIIDRVGGGDSFSGGLIHGLLTKETQGEALEFAVAASALKHTIPGSTAPVTMMLLQRKGAITFLTNEGPPTLPAGNTFVTSQPAA